MDDDEAGEGGDDADGGVSHGSLGGCDLFLVAAGSEVLDAGNDKGDEGNHSDNAQHPGQDVLDDSGDSSGRIRQSHFGSEVGLPDPSGGIAAIIKNVLSWMLGIIGMIALIAFIISGIQYLTSRGDEKQIATAKRTMTYAAIGIIAALSGFIVIQAIDLALRATSGF